MPARQRIFLLSPADCSGERARLVFNPKAEFDLALRLRNGSGVPLGETFSFLSGLYFRGKLAYARAFARPAPQVDGIYVITAGEGLQPADRHITLADLQGYAGVPIALRDDRYRHPLERDTRRLATRIGAACQVILLGSIATNKYIDVLAEALGDRIHVPRQFLGLGDMSRGSLLLRCAAEGRELEYMPVAEIRATASPRRVRGKR